jgi:hypothetical protein
VIQLRINQNNTMSRSLARRIARAGRNHEFTWRYLFNFGSTVSYRLEKPRLSPAARGVAEDLKRDGIAITSVADLLGKNQCYEALLHQVNLLESDRLNEIEAARNSAENSDLIGQKTFNLEMLGSTQQLDLTSAYARFALQDEILQIANSYFGMYTRLRYLNVWHTLTTKSEARESQLWHRDREDFHILKMFLYLSDVDQGSGAFTYAAGSHIRRNSLAEPEHFVEGNVKRSTDEQMARVVARDRWKQGTGPKGTIIFADTSGYHKGGLARERDRVMFTCMFTSRASQSKELLQRPAEIPHVSDKSVRHAIA